MANRYPVLLGIDTTTEICSVAIQSPLGEICHADHTQSTHHAQAILPLIQKVLSQAKLILADIEFIAVSVGPGSFTGVRAGIATAQGLAYGLGIQVIPIGTLELIALGLPQEGQVQVISDARMQQFYVAGFEWHEGRLATIQAPCLLSEPELLGYLSQQLANNPQPHPIHLVGTGLRLIQEKLQDTFQDKLLNLNTLPELNLPQAKNLIAYLNRQVTKQDIASIAIEPGELMPLYIRNDVTFKKA